MFLLIVADRVSVRLDSLGYMYVEIGVVPLLVGHLERAKPLLLKSYEAS